MVKLAELESILLDQDLMDRVDLFCLSCRRRLARVGIGDRFADDGTPEASLSISKLSQDLRDFQQSNESVSLTCGCGVRSTFHSL